MEELGISILNTLMQIETIETMGGYIRTYFVLNFEDVHLFSSESLFLCIHRP